jgi:DNA repair exonuclease SbcCD nuclease subunit
MRLLLFSDLHLDTPFRWATREVARRRRQALRDTLLRIVQIARETRADAVLCGGDLYEHDRVSPDTAAFVRGAFERLHPTRVYVAPGNHDWYGPESLYRRADWSPNVHVFAEARLCPVELTDGLVLWGAAHRAPASTDGFLDGFSVDRSAVNLALFHGSERNWLTEQETGKQPHAPFDAEQIERAGLHHAFLGHYHRPRDAPRHTYPGNPDPLTFGEAGERGVVIAEIASDGSVRRERRAVATTQLSDVELDVSGAASLQDVRDRLAELLHGRSGAARVTVSGELAAEVQLQLDELETATPWMDAVVVRIGTIHSSYDLEALGREQTVRGQFVRDVMKAADLPDEMRRRVLVTGLRALDGRDDLEVV